MATTVNPAVIRIGPTAVDDRRFLLAGDLPAFEGGGLLITEEVLFPLTRTGGVTIPTPTIVAPGGAAAATPDTIPLTVTLPHPFIGAIRPLEIILNVTIPTPSTGAPVKIVDVIPLTFEVPTPTVTMGAVATPPVIPTVVTVPAPSVQSGILTPLVIPMTVTIPTPSVAAGGADLFMAREAVVVAVSEDITDTAVLLVREGVVVSHHFPELNTETRIGRLGVIIAISRPHGWD